MNRRYNQPWGHNNEPNRSNNQVKTSEWPWIQTRFWTRPNFDALYHGKGFQPPLEHPGTFRNIPDHGIITGAPPQAGTGLKMQTIFFFKVTLWGIYRWLEIYRGLVTFGSLIRHFGQHKEYSQEKDFCFLGNDTFPNLDDALVYEGNFWVNIWRDKFTSDYLRVNLPSWNLSRIEYENKSNLPKLSTLSEPSIVKSIENQSEHLSKLTLYHLKERVTRRSRRAR